MAGIKIILAGAEPGEEWDGVSWKTRGGEDGNAAPTEREGWDLILKDEKLRPRWGLNREWMREESSAGRFGAGERSGTFARL